MAPHASRNGQGERERWTVAKVIKPHQRGAIKLARVHGWALLCVRYRENADGTERLTTIELIVERAVVQRREDPVVSFKIKPEESALRRIAKSKGAQYDGRTALWSLPRSEVVRLGLKRRITATMDQIYQEHVHP